MNRERIRRRGVDGKVQRMCGLEAFERQREWKEGPLVGLWLNQGASRLLEFMGLGSWVGRPGVSLQLRKVRRLLRRKYWV